MEIIGVIVAGIIIGLLGKFVAPGNSEKIPIWLTILRGIGGVIIGWSSTPRSAATAARDRLDAMAHRDRRCGGSGDHRPRDRGEEQSQAHPGLGLASRQSLTPPYSQEGGASAPL